MRDSDDLIERLRDGSGLGLDSWDLLNEAADEIETLRKREKALRGVLKRCSEMLDLAFDYDGDVFGIRHNDAVDVSFDAALEGKDER